MTWDGPVSYQSKRTHLYEAALEQLQQQGHVYDCSCTRKELAGITAYPGTCREGLPPGRSPRSLRVRVGDAAIDMPDRLQPALHQQLAVDIGDLSGVQINCLPTSLPLWSMMVSSKSTTLSVALICWNQHRDRCTCNSYWGCQRPPTCIYPSRSMPEMPSSASKPLRNALMWMTLIVPSSMRCVSSASRYLTHHRMPAARNSGSGRLSTGTSVLFRWAGSYPHLQDTQPHLLHHKQVLGTENIATIISTQKTP